MNSAWNLLGRNHQPDSSPKDSATSESALSSIKRELEVFKNELELKIEENERLVILNSSLNDKMRAMEGEMERMTSSSKLHSANASVSEKQLSQLQADLSQSREQNRVLLAKLEAVSAEKDALAHKSALWESEKRELSSRLGEFSSQATSLRGTVALLTSQLESARTLCSDYESQLTLSLSQQKDTKSDLTAAKRSISDLKETVESLEVALASKTVTSQAQKLAAQLYEQLDGENSMKSNQALLVCNSAKECQDSCLRTAELVKLIRQLQASNRFLKAECWKTVPFEYQQRYRL